MLAEDHNGDYARTPTGAEADAGVALSPAPAEPLLPYARGPALPVSSEVKITCPMSNRC